MNLDAIRIEIKFKNLFIIRTYYSLELMLKIEKKYVLNPKEMLNGKWRQNLFDKLIWDMPFVFHDEPLLQ